jgi:hypothetical protein
MPRVILLAIVAIVSVGLFTACYSKPPSEHDRAVVSTAS